MSPTLFYLNIYIKYRFGIVALKYYMIIYLNQQKNMLNTLSHVYYVISNLVFFNKKDEKQDLDDSYEA